VSLISMHKRRNYEEIFQIKMVNRKSNMDPYKSQIKKLIRHGSLKLIRKISIEEESRDETKCQWCMVGEEALTPSSHNLSRFKQQ
jgi:hypothetical protein